MVTQPPLTPGKTMNDNRPIGDEAFPIWPEATLVGRTAELADLAARVAAGRRLLTLTGPGGIGKTRLAVHLARRIAANGTPRVVMLGLAELAREADVLAALAAALDVRVDLSAAASTIPDDLRAELDAMPTLLVLDNAEHLAELGALVNRLLVAVPSLQVLVTSQRRLVLSIEEEIPVGVLEVPSRGADDADPMSAAVRLFVQQGGRARTDLTFGEPELRIAGEITRQLDGLPLAIELAAARLRVLSLPDLRERLAAGLPLLSGGARDLPTRQRAMRDTIRWGYDLLAPREQTLLRRLSVFADGFELRAAEAICADPDGGTSAASSASLASGDVLDLLTALEDASFLTSTDSPATGRRFRLLETIRQFSREALEATGEQNDLARRHAAWFSAQAERAEPQLTGAGLAGWLAWLDGNLANLRRAAETSFTIGPAGPGVTLVGALWRYWDIRGQLGEARVAMEQALPHLGEVAAPVRATLLTSLGNIVSDLGQYQRAEQLYTEALAIRRAEDDDGDVAGLLNILGILLRTTGQHDRARALHRESLGIRTRRGETRGIGLSHLYLGQVALAEGALDAARAESTEALRLLREAGDADQTAYALHTLGLIALEAGRTAAAGDLLREAESAFVALGDRFGVAYARQGLGRLALAEGRRPAAAAALAQALDLRRDIGYVWGVVDSVAAIGHLAVAAGRFDVGLCCLLMADQRRQELGAPPTASERTRDDRARQQAQSHLGAAVAAPITDEVAVMAPERLVDLAFSTATELASTADSLDAAPSPPPAGTQSTDARRQYGLTAREREILVHVADGQSDREIADLLFLSRRTVSEHVRHILGKMDVPSRTAATALALRTGLV